MCGESARERARINPTLRTCPGITVELEQLLRLRAAGLNDPDLNEEQLKQIIEEILMHVTNEVGHSFSRRYSFGEHFSLHSCDHDVGRTTCDRMRSRTF